MTERAPRGIEQLVELMARLRDPQTGCPWDLKQTWASLVPHTLEEVYELADAIEKNDAAKVREELGDYLFQAVFYARIAEEAGLFNFDDAAAAIVAKLLYRHPHVFPDGSLESRRDPGVVPETDDIKATWEALKQDDRRERDEHSALDDVPMALPALQRAQKLQKRASNAGMDWSEVSGVYDKLAEEVDELREAAQNDDADAVGHELGDILFCCVNLSRHYGFSAEQVLRAANARFEQRFRAVETELAIDGRAMSALDEAELDAAWERAKQRLRDAH